VRLLAEKEIKMSKAKDEEVLGLGIKAREHFSRPYGIKGKRVYPFKAMVVNDFFKLDEHSRVISVRACLKRFYKLHPGRRFTVRPNDAGYWICRRVA